MEKVHLRRIISLALCVSIVFSVFTDLIGTVTATNPDFVYLSDLNWESASSGVGIDYPVQKDKNISATAMVVAGLTYNKGLGTHTAPDTATGADIVYDISGIGYDYFEAMVGIQDQGSVNQVKFTVLVDNVEKATYTATAQEDAKRLQAEIKGGRTLTLRVNSVLEAGNTYGAPHSYDASNWCNAMLFKSTDYASDMLWSNETKTVGPWSERNLNLWNAPLSINNVVYEKGIGTHANSDVEVDISNKGYKGFEAYVGSADSAYSYSGGMLQFVVISYDANGQEIKRETSPIIYHKAGAYRIYADVAGASKVVFRTLDGGDGIGGDGAIWGEPKFSKRLADDIIFVSDLQYVSATCGVFDNLPKFDANIDGNLLTIGTKTYSKGIGTHSYENGEPADVIYNIKNKGYKMFFTEVGVDEASGSYGSVQFLVLGDGVEIFRTPVIRGSDPSYVIRANVEGVEHLTLRVLNGDGYYYYDRANWGNAKLYKEFSYMEAFLEFDSVYNGMYLSQNSLTVSGTTGGIDQLDVYLDNEIQDTLTVNQINWETTLMNLTNGEHQLKFIAKLAGQEVIQKTITINKVESNMERFALITQTTKLELGISDNKLFVFKLQNQDNNHNWINDINAVNLPDKVAVSGTDKTVLWQFERADVLSNNNYKSITFVFASTDPQLRLESVWSAYESSKSPVQHHMNVYNIGNQEITVYSQPTFDLNLTGQSSEKLELLSITKGANAPDGIGTYYDDIINGFKKNIYTTAEYNDGTPHDAGYIPYAGIQGSNHGLYTGWEWTHGRVDVSGGTKTTAQNFKIVEGLNADFKTDIPAGEVYYIPSGFIGCYSGDREDGSNEMVKWFYDYMMPPENKEDKYPTVPFNIITTIAVARRNWTMSDKNFYNVIDELSEIGIEEAIVDIGWWAQDGDFRGTHERWQSGMANSSQYVHDKGMDFGLYFRWYNGMSEDPKAISSVGPNAHPEWFVSDDKFAALDLGNKEAMEFTKQLMYDKYTEFNLDTYRSDMGPIVAWSKRINRHKYGVDTAYWSTRGFYEVLDYLNANIPNFKWENCDCGGALKDFASMSRSARIFSTDSYSSDVLRKSFYDASYVLPAMQIQLPICPWYFGDVLPNDDYNNRSLLLGQPLWFVQTPSAMRPEEKESFENAIRVYKDWMRPLVKNANIYHVLPRANGVDWDGMEYFDPNTGKGAVLVFKPTTTQNTKNVKLKALDANKEYHIWFEDKTLPYQVVTGSQLMNIGVTFELAGNYQSEIMYIQAKEAGDTILPPSAFGAITNETVNINAGYPVRLEWQNAARATEYEVSIFEEGSNTPVTTIKTTQTFTVIEGLQAQKTYLWKVKAKGLFGITEISGNPKINTQGTAYQESITKLAIGFSGGTLLGSTNADHTNALSANGVMYLDGLRIKAQDCVFTPDGKSVLTVPLDVTKGYKIFKGTFSLGEAKEGEAVKISIDVNSQTKAVVELSNGKKSKEFSVDVTGASEIKIITENKNQKILSQKTLQTLQKRNINDPFKHSSRIFGGIYASNYAISSDVKYNLWGMMSNFPKHGLFAAYIDDNNFVSAFIDRQYNVMATNAVVNGEAQGWQNTALPKNFDHSVYHNLKAVRNGNEFTFFVDNEQLQTRNIAIGAAQIGFVQEDTRVSYKNSVYTVEGNPAELSFGSSISGKEATGEWAGLSPVVIIGSPYLYVSEPQSGIKADLGTVLGSASSTSDVGFSATAAFDGDENTRWCASNDAMPQRLMADLGSAKNIESVMTNFELSTVWKYRLLYSVNGTDWYVFKDNTSNSTEGQTYTDKNKFSDSIKTRYIAIEVTDSGERPEGGKYWASIRELKVIEKGTGANIALGKSCAATSTTWGGASVFATADQTSYTRWCAEDESLPQSVQYNLGSISDITSIYLNFEQPSNWKYILEVSANGTDWEVYADNSAGSMISETIHTTEKQAQYVRITITGTSDEAWASIRDFDIYTKQPILSMLNTVLVNTNMDPNNPISFKGKKADMINFLGNATSNSDIGFSPAASFDGDVNTRWCASSDIMPQKLLVDLGSLKDIERIKTNFELSTAWKYEILYSEEGSTWKTLADKTNNIFKAQEYEDTANIKARYIAINVTGSGVREEGGNFWASIRELSVFEKNTGVNLALHKPCTATSASSYGATALAAFDSNANSRWCASSNNMPQTLYFDLGSSNTIQSMYVNFEQFSDWKYVIEVSQDETVWQPYADELSGNSCSYAAYTNEMAGRYVRIRIDSSSNGAWGSIRDFEVYTEMPIKSMLSGVAVKGHQQGKSPDTSDTDNRPNITILLFSIIGLIALKTKKRKQKA